jgi:hypothetical protein
MITSMQEWGPVAFAALPLIGAVCYFVAKKIHGGHPQAAETLELLAGFVVDLGHGVTLKQAALDCSPGAQKLVGELVEKALKA